MKSLEMGYHCSMLVVCCVAFSVVSHSELWIRFCPIMVVLSKLKLNRMCPKSCQRANTQILFTKKILSLYIFYHIQSPLGYMKLLP